MKLVIQRCQEASVSVAGETVGTIQNGLMVLIGVGKDDTEEIADKYLKKLLQLRIFEDENGKTNCSLKDVSGSLLLISQFTLYANCRHGNRPSFTDAGMVIFFSVFFTGRITVTVFLEAVDAVTL